MRTFVRLAGVAGTLVFAACSGKESAVSADLQKDLERASAASEITLPQTQPASQVVSAIERTTPPAPRRIAQSQRVPKHRAAPRATPAPVEVESPEASSAVEPEPVEVTPAPASEPVYIPSQRPQPVASRGGGSGDGDLGRGRGRGNISIGAEVIGSVIGVVLRGGTVDGDECDPRTDGRRGGIHTPTDTRFPIGAGTFPGSGRIGNGGRIGTGARIGGIIIGARR